MLRSLNKRKGYSLPQLRAQSRFTNIKNKRISLLIILKKEQRSTSLWLQDLVIVRLSLNKRQLKFRNSSHHFFKNFKTKEAKIQQETFTRSWSSITGKALAMKDIPPQLNVWSLWKILLLNTKKFLRIQFSFLSRMLWRIVHLLEEAISLSLMEVNSIISLLRRTLTSSLIMFLIKRSHSINWKSRVVNHNLIYTTSIGAK